MASVHDDLRPVTVVTGASLGIGRELALLAARRGEVLLVARGHVGLSRLADEISAQGGRAGIIALDLAQPGATDHLLSVLAARGLHCHQLVNNAGFGFVGPAATLDRGGQLACIDVNVRSLTDLTLALLPAMIRRADGGVLNVGSVAGFMAGPYSAVYYATKAYVHAFTEAIRAETAGSGVRVTLLCPGPVNTGFLARATGGARQFEASLFHVPAAPVAKAAWDGFMRGQDRVVPGWPNRIVQLAAWLLPRRALSALVLQRQRGRTTL
jgi:short-subunit dehydrogenase